MGASTEVHLESAGRCPFQIRISRLNNMLSLSLSNIESVYENADFDLAASGRILVGVFHLMEPFE
jgi:hypothetical protein